MVLVSRFVLSGLVLSLSTNPTAAFLPPAVSRQTYTSCSGVKNCESSDGESMSRRSILSLAWASTLIGLAPQDADAVDDDGTRGGVSLTPFNSLTFNYRGNSYGGLDASTLSEPSIPYADFLDRIDEVEFVEFLAPDGDAAYATFRPKEGEEKQKPVRIGEGFPIEQHDGWSSPAFVVKALQKKGIPYKFTVPALASYK
uniref:Uncharacterized protein n=1 Tax=Trieres chinensis TaxID=1514140 RepID=A0A7S2EIH9_TRICV|mmetsp:Transcript_25669/g.52563  ORF Transcript_25669/g.52563 Transcript_25669/m.52563 type:complete len:199 (+) Transcript_25669:78-674(+)|eukprot:CAMPEP_0183307656 /NCGR_PEP_ID=MMETSP0160_2-20130417/18592_1 /TAXON_ID=2839 ORGANISM="Odontella Sinensis, Strain Grunow 1884" /NCGR_SAMPLE_ID=MMETSP0160_2 /ASSEMBLY_ACC=CAM_ASM_000250 /LENGTH=198 /DNA_ID=CAMNT_0025471289 /DNA_START=57 /DNA_END=653 /DNA_ORIENTATION=-